MSWVNVGARGPDIYATNNESWTDSWWKKQWVKDEDREGEWNRAQKGFVYLNEHLNKVSCKFC